MINKTKKHLITLGILLFCGIILFTTSKLDYIQIILSLIFGLIVYYSIDKNIIIKYIWATVWILGLVFLLLLGYLPLFENKANLSDFINTQTRHINVTSTNDISNIEIKQWQFTKNQEVSNTEKEIFLKESPLSIINFTNRNTQTTANMTIQFADQTTVFIYPNTSFSLQISGDQQIIDKINGRMEYIQWQTNHIIIKHATLKKISDFSAAWLWARYWNNQKAYILEKAWWTIMENQSVRAFSHNIVRLANKIRPDKYSSYLDNERQYEKILWRTQKTTETYESKSNDIANGIVDEGKQGASKTTFLQFLGQ